MDDIDRAIQITEAMIALPPVPTHDWCDRAAAALALVRPGATAIVGLLYVDLEGRVGDAEVIGGARSASDTWPAQTGDAVRHACHRLARAPRLGFTPPLDEPTHIAPLSELARAPKTDIKSSMNLSTGLSARSSARSSAGSNPVPSMSTSESAASLGPLATVISPIPDDPCICLAPLNRGAFWRFLVAIVAGSQWDDSAVQLLRAVFPPLAKRARRVLEQRLEGHTPWLTDRDDLVLRMLAAGCSVREIARHIGRSPHTVNDQIKSLHKKLGTSSRGALLARAFGQPELFSP